jgi:hypothetical protein
MTTRPGKLGKPLSSDIGEIVVPQAPDPAAALKAVMRKIAAELEAPTDPDLAENQHSPAQILQIVARPKRQKRP